MNSASTNEQITRTSPRSRARAMGVVYLLFFLTAILAQFLLSHGFPRLGLAVNLISTALYAAVALLFYFLFKPVNKILSLIAALISLAGCAVTALASVNLVPSDLNPLAFFGLYCILLGCLVLGSAFLPRALGVLLVLAGLGWLVFPFLPPASHVVPYLEGLGILAEGLLMLWLLFKGVNEQRWREQAAVSQLRSRNQL